MMASFTDEILFDLLRRARLGSSWIRVLAYHGTPDASIESLEEQLRYLAERFQCVDQDALSMFLNGSLRLERPGLVISFDDGLRDNYTNAAPMLERHGLSGWFFATSTLPSLPESEQLAFCGSHELIVPPGTEGRIAMNWAELRDLAGRGHTIGCHTANHRRFRSEIPAELVESEISTSSAVFLERLGRVPSSFAWVGGEPDTYSVTGLAAIRKAGYRFAFTTRSAPVTHTSNPFLLHRTVLDASMPFGAFRMKVAGASDLAHAASRSALERSLPTLVKP
jgi:peptidoglycan/xylan/chitin deacetylase (PgdA/CDA1 family)